MDAGYAKRSCGHKYLLLLELPIHRFHCGFRSNSKMQGFHVWLVWYLSPSLHGNYACWEPNCNTDRILEPLVFGDYPEMMKKNVGSRLPSFTKVQSELIKGSFDFIGINHYFSLYVSDRQTEPGIRDYNRDMSIYYRGIRLRNSFSRARLEVCQFH